LESTCFIYMTMELYRVIDLNLLYRWVRRTFAGVEPFAHADIEPDYCHSVMTSEPMGSISKAQKAVDLKVCLHILEDRAMLKSDQMVSLPLN